MRGTQEKEIMPAWEWVGRILATDELDYVTIYYTRINDVSERMALFCKLNFPLAVLMLIPYTLHSFVPSVPLNHQMGP